MYDEKKLVRLAMITLFLSLMIVYVLLYQVKGDKLKIQDTLKNTNGQISITSKTGTKSAVFTEKANQIKTGSTYTGISVNTTNSGNKQIKSGGIIASSTPLTIKILSGTEIYYGISPIIEKLGIKYQYALKDPKNIYYFNLGKSIYDFGNISKSLGGNTFTLITEQDIFQNKLFGKKVIFINLPENKDKLVIMAISMVNEVRLIQIPYEIYHKSKEYIKNLFID